ncbi:MAG: 3-oxoacyl-ACP synthase [Azospira oryzae]|nr:MAG: 3-oxoacyl-ACP synthase [Azospira oryzae]
MSLSRYAVIAGSGSYLPTQKISNDHFLNHSFFGTDGKKLDKGNEEIIRKFQHINGIDERRYVTDDLVASDIAFYAAEQALASSGIDKETFDYIIVAHNFGDIKEDNRRSDMVPTLASRVKQRLDIKNPKTVSYDLPFGCAGWLQGIIQANYFIKSGDANRVLVIGTDTLSRIADPHDRDSMIYADGAGAVILESRESEKPVGILSHHTETFTDGHAYALRMDKSSNPDYAENTLFLKMKGHKLYEQALKLVPHVINISLNKANVSLNKIDKILIHQANTKMDEAIVTNLKSLCQVDHLAEDFMPMTISWLGNSSVATIPTLYDLISKNEMKNHSIRKNSIIAFAAVGAGININAVIYQVPEN